MVNTFQFLQKMSFSASTVWLYFRKNCLGLIPSGLLSKPPGSYFLRHHTFASTISRFHMVAQFFTTYTCTLTWGRKNLNSKSLRKGSSFFSSVHVQSCQALQPLGLQPTKLLYPWDFPGKNTRVGHHFLLQFLSRNNPNIRGRVGCCLILEF